MTAKVRRDSCEYCGYDRKQPYTFHNGQITSPRNIIMPYLDFQSEVVTRCLKLYINKFYGFLNLKIIFQSTCQIKSSFPYKDPLCK